MAVRLSIIIPAYNEAARIGPTLRACETYRSMHAFPCEIIVVDDGSTDGTAAAVQREHLSDVRVISHAVNLGKGAAVRSGMNAASGELRLFTDADNSTGIEFADALITHIDNGADIVIGSRRLPESSINMPQGPARDLLGAIFRTITRVLFPVGVSDTQNGFKLFSARAAHDVFSRTRTDGFAFDIEVLMLAQKLGFKVAECPIVWQNSGESRVRFAHMVRMLIDLVVLRWRFL